MADPVESDLDESESSETDEESSSEREEIEKQSRSEFSAEDATELRKLGEKVESIEGEVDNDVKREAAEDEIDGTQETTDKNQTLYGENGKLAEVANDAKVEQNRILEQNRKGRLVTRNKFWAWILPLGVSAALFGLTVFGIVNANKKLDPAKDPLLKDLTQDEIALIKAAVDRWRNQPDVTFWTTLADYVKAWAPSLQAEKLFMTYTKQLLAPKDWPQGSANWVLDRVDELVKASDGAKAMDVVYRKVATFSYAPDPGAPTTMVPVPRYLAAELCDLALGQIIKIIRARG